MKQRKKTSVVWTTTKEEMQKMLDSSFSIVEVLKKLGFDGYNGNHRTLKQRVFSGEFDLTIFEENRKEGHSSRAEILCRSNKKDNKDIFQEGTSHSRTDLKKRMIKDFDFEYKCVECGIKDKYNNKPISLQLDHINGINNDNRLENLRFLCPNCHSQTESFSGKRFIKDSFCECGNKKSKQAIKCKECRLVDQRNQKYPERKCKIDWIDKESMEKLIWEEPTIKIAKKLGVSDVAVYKFCKKNNITKPPRGYWSKQKNNPPET